MKVIVAGSRTITDAQWVHKVLDERLGSLQDVQIVSGMALHWLWHKDAVTGGPDRFGYDWAINNDIPVLQFKPDWSKGRGAGINRNVDMAREADMLIAFWDGKSTGTDHMIKFMKMIGKPVIIEKQIQEASWFE
jgi:hypothetical protein